MKKLIYSIMVVFLLTLGVIGTSSMEVDAAVSVNDMDFDLSGSIGIVDIAALSFKYQLTSSSNNWSSKYDLNADNIIDIYDIILISKVIGTPTIVNDNTDITSKFIDEEFKALIYATINKSSPAPILYSDVKEIKAIITYSREISNFSGIEYFKSLTVLYCPNNKLTDLDLTSNEELTSLDCRNNSITSLNLSNNTKLMFLSCSNNKLTSLNVNKNISLYELNCDNNQLTALDVNKNVDLSSLSCKNNGLTTLDISKNEYLRVFNCTGNQITTLYSKKDTWSDSYYKEQYTDASHEITTNNLNIEIIGRGGSIEPSGENVVSYAMQFLGRPYVYGAIGPNYFDCSGLTYYVYKTAAKIEIGRTTYDQVVAGREVSQSDLQPGDLVFTSPSHVGIYVGGGNMIHAPRTGDVVKISKVYSFYAGRRILS